MTILRIYLAARYSRWHELADYAQQLKTCGFIVTSRWLEGRSPISSDGLSEEATLEQRAWFAEQDWNDLMAADTCISFTEPSRSSNTRGGRHVELGAALAAGKRVIVVGHRENVFHCLPQVEFFRTWQECSQTIVPYSCAYPRVSLTEAPPALVAGRHYMDSQENHSKRDIQI